VWVVVVDWHCFGEKRLMLLFRIIAVGILMLSSNLGIAHTRGNSQDFMDIQSQANGKKLGVSSNFYALYPQKLGCVLATSTKSLKILKNLELYLELCGRW
jgi:hypothetical protein